jgi:O-antigen ligase
MKARLRSAVVPAYLLLCIVIGGSTQGIITQLVLQLVGLAIIAWALLTRENGALPPPARHLAWLIAGVLLLFAVQLIPLPPALWSKLPGRDVIVEGYRLLGQSPGWLPLSIAPYHTMATLPALIPPLAVLAAMLLTGGTRASWIAAAVLAGTLASVLLGSLQVGSGRPELSPWYLYRISNFGSATGFFANSNHMGALLLVSLPLLIALVRHMRGRAKQRRAESAALILAVAGVLVLGVGVILNGSLAVLLLGVPAVVVSASLLRPRWLRSPRPLAIAAGVSAAALLALMLSPIGRELVRGNSASLAEREKMWSTTIEGAAQFAPFGSGAGTFRNVYPLLENPADVTAVVVNHAHNDYLEIVMETGVLGLPLLVLFLLWWLSRVRLVARPHAADAFSQAAAIASGILLLHSIVDYPLRMPALNAIMAACLALLARPRRAEPGQVEDLWPTRHLAI